MKVIRAGILGFCRGVSRAVDMARQASLETDSAKGGRVYTLGPLIHNSGVLKSLGELGVACLKECEEPPQNSILIIRAHGLSPFAERTFARRGRIIDATCPHVKVSQRKAKEFAEKGYRVFLAGEENHAEIEGIRGYVEDGAGVFSAAHSCCFVVSNPAEAETAAAELFSTDSQAKTTLIGQTTISMEEYRAIGERIRQFFPAIEIVDSICGATVERQKALAELGRNVDAVIIAGDVASANTRRLLSLVRELGKPAWIAETREDIPPEIRGYKTVGISAGASTPESLIEKIEKALKDKQ
jgi:4-hydroxy-3-methylbut-2-enyl diphosphate reductase